MPADLTAPFKESCCDGGVCSDSKESARPCGCDPGANWVCQVHQVEGLLERGLEAFDKGVDEFLFTPEAQAKTLITRLLVPNQVGEQIMVKQAVFTNPLEEHLHTVVNPCWNYAGRISTYEEHLQNAVLGLAGEVGEVADVVKKMLYHTEGVDYTYKLKHELGDAAFYFAKVLEITGLTLEEVLAANKEKLQSRHPELGKVQERFAKGYIGG